MRLVLCPLALATLLALSSCGGSTLIDGRGADASSADGATTADSDTSGATRGESLEPSDDVNLSDDEADEPGATDDARASEVAVPEWFAAEGTPAIDRAVLDEINALVPDRHDIVFESFPVGDDDERMVVAAPSDWEIDEGISIAFEPPRDGFDFDTEMKVNGACQGICTPQDWSAVIDQSLDEGNWFNNDADTDVVIDSALGDGGRVVVAHSTDGVSGDVFINVFRWDDTATTFFRCNVDLGANDTDLEAAFVAACQASMPLWLDIV